MMLFAKGGILDQIKRMDVLEAYHDTFLTVMACVVAMAAGFTGLSMTRDLSAKPVFQKKVSVALAAVALGGGIWAMHFVAMLGLPPVPVSRSKLKETQDALAVFQGAVGVS